jgi:hypothetical protein
LISASTNSPHSRNLLTPHFLIKWSTESTVT